MMPEISIHALLAESDQKNPSKLAKTSYFYPRSPCGERLNDAINGCNPDFISIHALLAESDVSHQHLSQDFWNFYPRSPCGERRTVPNRLLRRFLFLSTLSLRRATYLEENESESQNISIHALLAESDAAGRFLLS